MSNKKKLIPALRFPEFKEDGEWEDLLLSEVLEEHGIKSQGDEDVYSVSVHKGIINQIEHLGRSFAASNTDKYKRVLPGDIVYTKSPTGSFPYGIIKQSKIEYPVIVSPLYGVFTPKTKWLGSILDAYFEAPERTTNYLAPIVQKGAKNTINIRNDIFLSKSLVLPVRKKEQQKIADCLSSLDDLLAAHNEKLELLKGHKKGLMQNLFPQEGERVPKFRFPEFENDGEWEEKKLGEIGENLDSRRVPITSTVREKGDIPYYGASGIIDFVKDHIFDEELLLISEDGANLIARTYPIAFTISGKTWVNNHAHVLRFNCWATQVLVENYLNSRSIEDFLTGMAQPKLNRSKLDIIPISLPNSLDEQQKIASCLSAVDDLIKAETEKIEALKAHKKGLMQGLFPKMEY